MKKPTVLAIAAAAIIAALIIYYMNHRSGSDREVIRVSGNIEVTAVEASFRIPGRVSERLVDEGERVRAGQLIARLESDDLAHEVARRRAEFQAAQAVLAELLAGSR